MTVSAVLAAAGALVEAVVHTSFHSPALARNLGTFLDSFVIASFIFILTYVEVSAVRERRIRVARDMKVVADLNHHIRNALCAIQYAAYSSQDKSKLDVINSAIERIDGILHDLYPAIGVKDQTRHKAP